MKKLHDKRGATILMALFLLLLATMVSTVILTAVASVSKHITRDREAQQAYLTVSSAAELLRDSIQSATYDRLDQEETTYKRNDRGRLVVDQTSSTHTETEPEGLMGQWLAACIADDGQWVSRYEDTLLVSVQDADGETLSPVQVQFFMAPSRDYGTENSKTEEVDFTLIFSLPEGDDCRMTLHVTGTREFQHTWGGTASAGYVWDKQTTTIRWEHAEIYKGVA